MTRCVRRLSLGESFVSVSTDLLAPRRSDESRLDGCDEMDARGVRLEGHVLGPLTESRTIRTRAGEIVVGEGPVAEQAVHIAGFNILECADLDEALEVASKNPGASFGILELRPIEW